MDFSTAQVENFFPVLFLDYIPPKFNAGTKKPTSVLFYGLLYFTLFRYPDRKYEAGDETISGVSFQNRVTELLLP